MTQLMVKIRMPGKQNKIRKLMSIDSRVYPALNELVQGSNPYDPQTLLDRGEWYYIREFSQSDFFDEVYTDKLESTDYNLLAREDLDKISFVLVEQDDGLYFQNITRSRLISKKGIFYNGKDFTYEEGMKTLVINDEPDAVYSRDNNMLFFKNLSAITGIFKGIGQLYREATEKETAGFLQQDYIYLVDGYSAKDVKTPNRKRIALAIDTMSRLESQDRKKIFSYIGEYCQDLIRKDGAFEVGNEESLKRVLFGIEQRFYTTPVGKEKRLANSIIKIG